MPGVLALLQKHGAEIVVADFDVRSLEGDRRSVYVVLKFASEKAALGWYNDPAYEPRAKYPFCFLCKQQYGAGKAVCSTEQSILARRAMMFAGNTGAIKTWARIEQEQY